MIYHPLLITAGLFLLIIGCYLEVRYIRAGFPQSRGWLLVLFFCGGGFAACVALALLPEPKVVFQNIGALGSLLVGILLGGIGAAYTGPRYAKIAKRNRSSGKNRI